MVTVALGISSSSPGSFSHRRLQYESAGLPRGGYLGPHHGLMIALATYVALHWFKPWSASRLSSSSPTGCAPPTTWLTWTKGCASGSIIIPIVLMPCCLVPGLMTTAIFTDILVLISMLLDAVMCTFTDVVIVFVRCLGSPFVPPGCACPADCARMVIHSRTVGFAPLRLSAVWFPLLTASASFDVYLLA